MQIEIENLLAIIAFCGVAGFCVAKTLNNADRFVGKIVTNTDTNTKRSDT